MVRARADLQRLHVFVAESDPARADRIQRRLLAGIDALTEQPRLGRVLEEGCPIRQWMSGEHVLHYAAWSDEEVIALRMRHGREARQ